MLLFGLICVHVTFIPDLVCSPSFNSLATDFRFIIIIIQFMLVSHFCKKYTCTRNHETQANKMAGRKKEMWLIHIP